jgi:hypothetical protein
MVGRYHKIGLCSQCFKAIAMSHPTPTVIRLSQSGNFKNYQPIHYRIPLYFNWRAGNVLVCTFTYKKYKMKIILNNFKNYQPIHYRIPLYFNWRASNVLVCTFTYKKYKMKIIFISYLQHLIIHFSNLLLLL